MLVGCDGFEIPPFRHATVVVDCPHELQAEDVGNDDGHFLRLLRN